MAAFRLRLLGGASIEGPDGLVAGRVGQRRQLALLAFLALHAGRPVRRDRVLALLWPDADEAKARSALSDALYLIREALGESALPSAKEELCLDAKLVRSDVADFEAAIEQSHLEEAVSHYAGPFLDGFHHGRGTEFDQWLEAQRTRLASSYLLALETLATRFDQEGAPEKAAAWWRPAVALDPLNSRLTGSLSRSLRAAGDPAGALRTIQAHASFLHAELGIALPPELRAFVDEISAAESSGDIFPRQLELGRPTLTVDPRPPPRLDRLPASESLPASPVSVATAPPGADRVRPRTTARTLLFLASTGPLALAAWILGTAFSPPEWALDPDLAVALPFRTAGASSDLSYLGEGIVDLLTAKLTGEGGSLRLDPSTLVSWRQSPLPELSASDAVWEDAIQFAREAGAGRLIVGSAVGFARELSLQMILIDTGSGEELGRASVTGSEEELASLVDRLAAEVLSRSAGVELHRIAQLTSTSLPALRAYLSGRAAHRRGDYDHALLEYGKALEIDSTFALAGMGARRVSGWVGGAGPLSARGRDIALRHADRLSERDQVALFGRIERPRGGAVTGSLLLEEREAALRLWADHPELWYLRGEVFFHQGGALGSEDRWERAAESFRRAIALDSGFAEPVHHLASSLANLGDTAALRTLVADQLARTPVGPIADYLRWRAYHTLGDPALAPPPLDEMDRDATLYWIGIEAQDVGEGLREGAEAVQLRARTAGTLDERQERHLGLFAYALNGGRPAEAVGILRALPAMNIGGDFVARLAILSALYADGDTAFARESVAMLGRASATGSTAELNDCIVTLWKLHYAPGEVSRPKILSDEEAIRADSAPWAVPRRLCALVRDAQWLTMQGAEDREAAIHRLDRLLDLSPVTGLVHNGHAEWVHLALSRLHERAGDSPAALRALGRRTFYNGWQPYLAVMLREEGRLAAQLGVLPLAERAWTHFLAFRSSPEPVLLDDQLEVWAALDALQGRH